MVRGLRRSPLPPARTIAMVFLPTLLIEYMRCLLFKFMVRNVLWLYPLLP
jgi:hypothetical protein